MAELQLRELGERLQSPPPSKDELVELLEVAYWFSFVGSLWSDRFGVACLLLLKSLRQVFWWVFVVIIPSRVSVAIWKCLA
jgi:hypothetical protein